MDSNYKVLYNLGGIVSLQYFATLCNTCQPWCKQILYGGQSKSKTPRFTKTRFVFDQLLLLPQYSRTLIAFFVTKSTNTKAFCNLFHISLLTPACSETFSPKDPLLPLLLIVLEYKAELESDDNFLAVQAQDKEGMPTYLYNWSIAFLACTGLKEIAFSWHSVCGHFCMQQL